MYLCVYIHISTVYTVYCMYTYIYLQLFNFSHDKKSSEINVQFQKLNVYFQLFGQQTAVTHKIISPKQKTLFRLQ